MLSTPAGRRGAATAPHHAAAEAGRRVLAEGGSAVEAMIAMAAAIAVAYPHMNAIGGDGFWLIRRPGAPMIGLEACGRAAAAATPAYYAAEGDREIPARGPRAVLTQPAAVAGWGAAWDVAADIAAGEGRTPLPLSRLLEDAERLAREGALVTPGQARLTAQKLSELAPQPGFAPIFAPGGAAPADYAVLRQSALAETLAEIGRSGPRAFYDGAIADAHGRFLRDIGAPLAQSDLAATEAQRVAPLKVSLKSGAVYNMPPPTQGVASLMILALFERLSAEPPAAESFGHLHGLVEATKRAFILRDAGLGDPDAMEEPAEAWLAPERLDEMASRIDPETALPWPRPAGKGDTVWMGAADASGVVVSYIQSIYWEFGSGVVCPETGVLFQNRGAGFRLGAGPNQLAPGKRPIHTLNPALAELADGRTLAYGAMGGDGQPQFQSALYSRIALYGQPLQEAVTAPRWLLGRTWGQASNNLKIESRFGEAMAERLRAAGHDVEITAPFTDLMGHAGAVALRPDGVLQAAADPRSDGAAALV